MNIFYSLIFNNPFLDCLQDVSVVSRLVLCLQEWLKIYCKSEWVLAPPSNEFVTVQCLVFSDVIYYWILQSCVMWEYECLLPFESSKLKFIIYIFFKPDNKNYIQFKHHLIVLAFVVSEICYGIFLLRL